MSFLTPLFAAGMLALSLPILFHLIRRAPKGTRQFSTLMFLETSPPTLTRRSRLDHRLLLLLRALALAALVLAFTRPFLREVAELNVFSRDLRRTAIIVDRSASLRRGDLWEQALAEAQAALGALNRQEDFAVYVFDDRVQTLVDFASIDAENAGTARNAQEAQARWESRRELARRQLEQLTPSWGGSDAGMALSLAADGLVAANQQEQSDARLQVVLITDRQRGLRLETLDGFEWPEQVEVDVRTLAAPGGSNASLELIADGDAESVEIQRVRVTNEEDSAVDSFVLHWLDDSGRVDHASQQTVYVPPGQSRVESMSLPVGEDAARFRRLELVGDDFDFDNTVFAIPPERAEYTILYAGTESADDPEGLRFYLTRTFVETPERVVQIQSWDGATPVPELARGAIHFVVLTQNVAPEYWPRLMEFVSRGGTMLVVVRDESLREMLAAFFDHPGLQISEGRVKDYAMLAEVDFDDPLFSQFADPAYSDFTKIRFWKYRALDVESLGDVDVIARFDNEDPAVIARRVQRGRVIALASGWHPRDSRLALSSKFVPILETLLRGELDGQHTLESLTVHGTLELPADRGTPVTVVRPDGTEVALPADRRLFRELETPGIYQVRTGAEDALAERDPDSVSEGGDGLQEFAVNLAAAEGRTALLPPELLEQRGVALGMAEVSEAAELERRRQMRDVELESEQQLWRWLLIAAAVLLISETWLAGRISRSVSQVRSAG